MHTVTAGLRTERGHCDVCDCRPTAASLTSTHLLLTDNDTVPISVWRGGGMHSTEYPVVSMLNVLYYTSCAPSRLRRLATPRACGALSVASAASQFRIPDGARHPFAAAYIDD